MDDVRNIYFAKSLCKIDQSTLSSTGVECTLERNPTCGSYIPVYTAKLGKIPSAGGVSEEVVTCSIQSVTPTTELNLLGDDNLTFTGEYLPYDIVDSEIEIKFSDAQ